MDIFRKILDTRSRFCIIDMAEEALPLSQGKDKETLEKILGADKNDEVYMLAHEHLGEREKAQEIRTWLKEKAQKNKLRQPR